MGRHDDLEPNILDRPGRLDQVFVFDLPAVKERLALLTRFSPWPVDRGVLVHAAHEVHGLSGAHLKEVCVSAALASAEAPERFGAALLPELQRVRAQHEGALEYELVLGRRRRAGFLADT